ncbi:blue copper protein-like [Forsythia ovata]|uniref:Blue copper protein-like n=1 Tax=Forsythia ovata TaxID=205694 RepID=A0ABD1W2F3_9LAMI
MASTAFLIAIICAVFVVPCLATDYMVGDDAGWKLNFNYTIWASGKEFFVGDRLIFKYAQAAHNVYRVNGTAFQQCMVPSAFEALTSGNDIITLATPGKKWYICGIGNHCAVGMRLAITVSYSVEAPAPAPATGTSAANEISPLKSCVWMLATLADAGEGYGLEGLGVGAGIGVGLVDGATGDGDGADVLFLNRGPADGGDGGVPQIEDVPQVDNNPLEEEENTLAHGGK